VTGAPPLPVSIVHIPDASFIDKLTHDPVALFTALLVLATALLWIFTGLLWWTTTRMASDAKREAATQADRMERSITEAANAAEAMRDANEIAERVGRASVRAYVSASRLTLFVKDGKVEATMWARNSGNSVAKSVCVLSSYNIQPAGDRDTITDAGYSFHGPLAVNIDEQWKVGIVDEKGLAAAALNAVIARGGIVMMTGYIKYQDVFDEWQSEWFQWEFSGVKEGLAIAGSAIPSFPPHDDGAALKLAT
jgi:hypothetical protein